MGTGCFKSRETICWDCAKACGMCAWSREFKPIDGWEVTPTRVYQTRNKKIDSFVVHSCPEFEKSKMYCRAEIKLSEIAQILCRSVFSLRHLKNSDIIELCRRQGVSIEIVKKNKNRKFFIDNKKEMKIPPPELVELFFGKHIGYTGF